MSLNLERILFSFLKENPVGEGLNAPVDIYLTEHNVFQPDIAFVSNGRLDMLHKDGIHGGPDLIFEILFARDEAPRRGTKKKVYASCGVQEYWLIDPSTQMISVFNARELGESDADLQRG